MKPELRQLEKQAAVCNRPDLRRLTLMLTEKCNLGCWMCDFSAKKSRQSRHLPIQTVLGLIDHPVMASLKVLTLTGGEPFISSDVLPLYETILREKPELCVNFSSNGTLIDPMMRLFSMVRDWRKVNLLISVDGITQHDVQRGIKGAFKKTTRTIEALKSRFPKLRIVVKFTVTPINHEEIEATHRYFASRGIDFTIKMVENNPFYTNKASFEENQQRFSFTSSQIDSVQNQLKSIVDALSKFRGNRRAYEIKRIKKSLDAGGRRQQRCSRPLQGAFIDCHLNVYTCKEYPPILNLAESDLDSIGRCPVFADIIEHERKNTGQCTYCNSQMQMTVRGNKWTNLLKNLLKL